MPSRTLSESEFEAIRQRVLAAAPKGMDEAGFNRWFTPRFDGAIAEAEQLPEARGGAAGRFVSNAASALNPVAMAQGLYGAVRHPIDTAQAVIGQQADQFGKAKQAFSEGRYSEAAGHGVASALPLIGPAAAGAGEQIGSGDVAGGLGAASGLLATSAIPAGVRNARRVMTPGMRDAAAGALEKGAASRYVDVMAPKVGANKTRLGNMANKVAPALASDPAMSAMSREGLHGKVASALAAAEDELDSVSQARNTNKVWHTKPILRDLQAKLDAVTAKTVRRQGLKAGDDVVPAPSEPRAAAIRQAMTEVQALGPVADYEALRRVRAAWDGPAKAVYNPSLTQDFTAKMGNKYGAADVTGVLRDQLAKFEPATAAANSKYSLYKSANDVLEAAAEVERTRPRVGRQIMARLTAVMAGGQSAGIPGAAAGYVLGPALDSIGATGMTTQLKTAQMMGKLAQAIRAGNVSSVNSLTSQLQDELRRLAAPAAAQAGKATSPSANLETQPVMP